MKTLILEQVFSTLTMTSSRCLNSWLQADNIFVVSRARFTTKEAVIPIWKKCTRFEACIIISLLKSLPSTRNKHLASRFNLLCTYQKCTLMIFVHKDTTENTLSACYVDFFPCRLGVTVNFSLLFRVNMAMSITIYSTFGSWVARLLLWQPTTFLSHYVYDYTGFAPSTVLFWRQLYFSISFSNRDPYVKESLKLSLRKFYDRYRALNEYEVPLS